MVRRLSDRETFRHTEFLTWDYARLPDVDRRQRATGEWCFVAGADDRARNHSRRMGGLLGR